MPIDLQAETDYLISQFILRIEALMTLFNAEASALAWKSAANTLAKELPGALAVGSLSYRARPDKPAAKTSTVVHVPDSSTRTILKPRVYGPKARILGPKPADRAKRYQELLTKRSGRWSRRDSKVRYICVGTKEFPKSKAAFYRMKRLDTQQEKWVKFASIVSDWKHIP